MLYSTSLDPCKLNVEQETLVGNVHSIFHDSLDSLPGTESRRNRTRGLTIIKALHICQRGRNDDSTDSPNSHPTNALVEAGNRPAFRDLGIPHHKNKGHPVVLRRWVNRVAIGTFQNPLDVHPLSLHSNAVSGSLAQVVVGHARIQSHQDGIGSIDELSRVGSRIRKYDGWRRKRQSHGSRVGIREERCFRFGNGGHWGRHCQRCRQYDQRGGAFCQYRYPFVCFLCRCKMGTRWFQLRKWWRFPCDRVGLATTFQATDNSLLAALLGYTTFAVVSRSKCSFLERNRLCRPTNGCWWHKGFGSWKYVCSGCFWLGNCFPRSHQEYSGYRDGDTIRSVWILQHCVTGNW